MANCKLTLLLLALVLQAAVQVTAHGDGGDDDDADASTTTSTSGGDDDGASLERLPDNPNVPLAFGLVILAGCCTAIGGLLPLLGESRFLPSFVDSNVFMASSLGFGSGMLTYLAFYHTLPDSLEAFGDTVGRNAELATLGSFFFGVAFLLCTELLVHFLNPDHSHKDFREYFPWNRAGDSNSNSKGNNSASGSKVDEEAPEVSAVAAKEGSSSGSGPSAAVEMEEIKVATSSAEQDLKDDDHQEEEGKEKDEEGKELVKEDSIMEEKKELNRMGIFTAVAIAVHNLPESIATFVETLIDPKIGVALAIAIAVHHIPEGICIAMPIYFATGSKLKAFLWTLFLGGVTQPLAALLAYLIFVEFWDEAATGVLSGFVSGMLVYIVVKNIFPTALRFDPHGRIVTASYFIGIFVLGLSLVGFDYTLDDY